MVRGSEYRPVRPGSVIERALVLHFLLTFAFSELIAPRRLARTSSRRRDDARAFVQRIWGPDPDLDQRFTFARMLHAQLLGAAFAVGMAAALVIGFGVSSGAPAPVMVGRGLLVLASFPLGMHGPVVVRTMATEWDSRHWVAAGRPDTWGLHALSQYRSSDLALGAGLTVAWAWFFVMVSTGTS